MAITIVLGALVAIVLALVFISEDDMPFDATKTCGFFGCSIFIQSAIQQPLKIINYTANRGRCKTPDAEKAELPRTLKFGERWLTDIAGCQVVELTVETDKGSWTVTWPQ